jgi:hypothetical protein
LDTGSFDRRLFGRTIDRLDLRGSFDLLFHDARVLP